MILVLVRSKHSFLQFHYCAEVNEFLLKVISRGQLEICEIFNLLVCMHEVEVTSCYYKIRKFEAIFTNNFPSYHHPSSPKYNLYFSQHY
jgi:hypothetical protein